MLFKVFQSVSHDPYLNLSIEEYLLTCYRQDKAIVFFYLNDPCVVLGRFQNPWRECRPVFLLQKKIPLLRRISGGGAVYHDKGNLNFSVITGRNTFNCMAYMHGIQKALSSLGVRTCCVNNNSLTVNGFKISGSASRYLKSRVLFHGTILVRSSLRLLNQCLLPAFTDEHCRGGGTASTRYKVTNLDSVLPGLTVKKVMHTLAGYITGENGVQPDYIREHVDWEKIHKFAEKNKSFEWVYGRTPGFEITMLPENNIINSTCIVRVIKGKINNIDIPGFVLLSEKITQRVKGRPFISSEIMKEIKTIQKEIF